MTLANFLWLGHLKFDKTPNFDEMIFFFLNCIIIVIVTNTLLRYRTDLPYLYFGLRFSVTPPYWEEVCYKLVI